MARTVIDLDREAAEKAKAIFGEKTLTGAVNAALRHAVQKAALAEMADSVANLDPDSRTALRQARDKW